MLTGWKTLVTQNNTSTLDVSEEEEEDLDDR
jgi:hypothetical protein